MTNFSVAIVTAAGETQVPLLAYLGGPILVDLPANLTPGPLTLRISYNGEPLPLVVLDISAAVPAILQASNSTTSSVYSEVGSRYPGDIISITVKNLAADIAPVDLSALSVSVGGVAQTYMR